MSLSSSALQPLFAQFQARYPMGSLISEFLTVHAGMYAVRAVVSIGGTVYATGMAAHSDLETAEDRAKVRALEALLMSATSTPSPLEPSSPRPSPWTPASFEPTPLPTQRSPEVATSDLSPDLITQDLIAKGLVTKGFKPKAALEPPVASATTVSDGMFVPATSLPSLTPPPQPTSLPDVTTVVGAPAVNPVVNPVVADFYSHINADADEEVPASQAIAPPPEQSYSLEEDAFPPSPSSPPAAATKPRRKTTASSEPPASSAVSVDLSDVIAQTDVELARLGWNKVQGREHLKQTYGKRSRQELDETELYDFLHYLQAQ